MLKVHIFDKYKERVHNIPCEPTWTLKVIYNILKVKEKKLFSNLLKKRKLKIYNPNPIARETNPFNYNEIHDSDLLDMGMQIKHIKSKEIMLVEYKYCDIPENLKDSMIVHRRHKSVNNGIPSVESSPGKSPNKKEYEYLYNEISASKYQEFNVVKTNRFGVRQKRILGIDRYNLYNFKQGISIDAQSLLAVNIMKKAKTKRPMLAIRTIIRIEADVKNNRQFMIYFNGSYSQGVYDYEASTESDRSEIIAKIKFLLFLKESEMH